VLAFFSHLWNGFFRGCISCCLSRKHHQDSKLGFNWWWRVWILMIFLPLSAC
jgi:hypothetical protein